jgi:hypothetical protein
MSSCLCKELEGAVFPVEIESLEDRVNNSIHALHVDEADHAPSSTPDFDEQRSIMLVVRSLHVNPWCSARAPSNGHSSAPEYLLASATQSRATVSE